MAKRENSEQVEQAQLPEEGQQNIVVGHVYKEDNSEAEVIPYFIDFAAARVNFSGVGRSNEEQMRTSDFLNRYKYVGPVASIAEEQVSNEDALKQNEAARKAEADRAAATNDPSRKTGV